MKLINENQIELLNSFINKNCSTNKRDLLLVSMSLKAGIKPAHLADLKIKDVLDQETGDVVPEVRTGATKTPLSDELRAQIKSYLKARFYQEPSTLRKVSLHLFSNREERGYFTDQSMATHLTSLMKRSGINGTSTALRNTYIKQRLAENLNLNSLVKMTAIKHPTTVIRYLTSDFDEVTQMADEPV